MRASAGSSCRRRRGGAQPIATVDCGAAYPPLGLRSKGLSADVQRSYDALRKVSPPDQDTHRRVDLCVGISKFIVSRASSRLGGKIPEQEQEWPEAGSLFNSSSSRSGSMLSILRGASEHSSQSSVKRQEAAAEAAACQAVLKVLQEQEKEELELQHLEAEAKRKVADEEAAAIKRCLEREEEEAKIRAKREEEYSALQKTLDEKRRKILQLEARKSLNAAQARIHVYDQMKTVEGQRQDTVKQRVEKLREKLNRTELIKIRDGSATSTTLQTVDLSLRALLGRLQLLRTPDWRSAARRTEGKRKRCARKQKRGKYRGGLLARLKANAGRPPIPSLFLSNVRSLDNKLDLLPTEAGESPVR
ncbi:hypothetical protein L3Q82_005273 [Scortum barcoo]|uniref:Uncharacterized protein n=1 Tax=Scortum barcoo TaxID=214431 RepID=A0ACB8V9Q5_9TELE|nr:hypothetical protein L3Q82_005273 [Scortum barcoo]